MSIRAGHGVYTPNHSTIKPEAEAEGSVKSWDEMSNAMWAEITFSRTRKHRIERSSVEPMSPLPQSLPTPTSPLPAVEPTPSPLEAARASYARLQSIIAASRSARSPAPVFPASYDSRQSPKQLRVAVHDPPEPIPQPQQPACPAQDEELELPPIPAEYATSLLDEELPSLDDALYVEDIDDEECAAFASWHFTSKSRLRSGSRSGVAEPDSPSSPGLEPTIASLPTSPLSPCSLSPASATVSPSATITPHSLARFSPPPPSPPPAYSSMPPSCTSSSEEESMPRTPSPSASPRPMRPLPRRRERLRPQLLPPAPPTRPSAPRLHSLTEETEPAPASPADLRISYPPTPSSETQYTKLDDIFQSAEKEYQRLRSIVEAPSLFDETLYDSDATVRVDEAPSSLRAGAEEGDVLSPIPISTAQARGKKSLFDELLSKDAQHRPSLRERCDSDATVRPDDFEPHYQEEEADMLSPIPISTAQLQARGKKSLLDEFLSKDTQLRARERCDSDATVRPDDFEPDALWSLVRRGLSARREGTRGRYDSDATVRQSDYLPRARPQVRTRPRARTVGKASRPDARVVRFAEHI